MTDDGTEDLSLELARDAGIAALETAALLLPHLGGLIRAVEVAGTRAIPTAGVFPSGRIVVGADWFLTLPVPDRVFVMAHEVMHLALRTHERFVGTDAGLFNIAHDYIINDILREELGTPVPAQGLDMPDARLKSAEQIVEELRSTGRSGGHVPSRSWSEELLAAAGSGTGSLGQALAETAHRKLEDDVRAGRIRRRRKSSRPRSISDLVNDRARARAEEEAKERIEAARQMLDVLTDSLERKLFPGMSAREAEARRARLETEIDRAVALGIWREKMVGGDFKVPDETAPVEGAVFSAEQLRAHPPWERSLQRWLEDVAPGSRTFSRPSRRQGDRADLVLPGHHREGFTLNLILDTSGSMWSELAKLLGVIQGFCAAAGIGRVRILQCGERLEIDELVEIEDLASYRILGGYGGDLGPGFARLAEDPSVDAAIVVTDGLILYPHTPMPYDVLWALVGNHDAFAPPFGRVLKVQI